MMHSGWRIAVVALPVVATLWMTCSSGAAQAAGTSAKGAILTPREALARLMTGNERFRKGEMLHQGQDAKQRESLVASQSPFAVILSCSDSRVPPAVVFDQGLGDLFVVRVAGNSVTRAGLESIDYAVDHLGTKLIMVLGHDSCGAVSGAVKECPPSGGEPSVSMPEIFANICPAVDRARKAGGDVLSRAIDMNVEDQVAILKRSAQFEKRVKDGSLMIVGARYDLRTGEVRLLSSD
jgi:carbonic anhydrase